MAILSFLADKPLFTLALCLGVGFLLGTSKTVRKATRGIVNVTIMTIVTAFLMSMLIQLSDKRPNIPDMLTSFFFALFSFSIGYAAGPNLARTKKGSRDVYLRQAALCVFYIFCAFAAAFGMTKLLGVGSKGSAVGMLAGAQTQSSIVALEGVPEGLEGEKMVTYAACYVIGTILMMLFVGNIAPKFLRSEEMARDLSGDSEQRFTRRQLTLGDMVKHYRIKNSMSGEEGGKLTALSAIQLRSYRVDPGAAVIGWTVGELEATGFGENRKKTEGQHKFEVITVQKFLDGKWKSARHEGSPDKVIIEEGDVVTVVGDLSQVYDRQNDGLAEVDAGGFVNARLVSVEVVVTASPKEDTDVDAYVRRVMSENAVVLEQVERGGEKQPLDGKIMKGDILRVTGVRSGTSSGRRDLLRPFIDKVGYVRETGTESKIGGVMLVIAAAIAISSLRIGVFSLGTGCVSMLLGLLLGYLREKKRNTAFYDATYVSTGALSFIQKLGLNLFIAGKTLGAQVDMSLFNSTFALALLCAALVSLIPLFLGLVFGKRVLKLHPVVLLASLCGSGTCSAALNLLNEKTESNEFAGSYAIPYAMGDILLTLMGVVFIAVI